MALRNVIMPDGHIISNVPEDVTDEEVVAKYNKKKTAEEEIPKAFEAPAEEPEVEEAEPSFAKDYARTITRTGASIANIPMELIRAGREAVGLDTEVAELYQRRVTEAVAKDVSGGVSEVPVQQILTSEGKVKTPETVGGMVFSAAPYLVGGAATMSTKLVKALPRLVQGIASGVAVDQILYDGEDNLANVLDEAGLVEAEGIAKDLVDFFAVEKDDGTLERRAKLIAEGVVLGGAFEFILGGTGAAIKAAKVKFGKNITDLNTDEKSELIVDYLKEARETVAYRAAPQPVDYSETAEGVAQVAQQNSSGIKRFMQQVFSSRGYFTPKAYNAFNDAQYAQRQVVAQAENISNRLQQAIRNIGDEVDSSELVERINKALAGEELEVPLPDSIAKEVEQARDLIDEMSGRLINSSIPNDEFREVISENAGSYIRRSYRLFEDTGYKPSANVRSNARDYIANVILNNKKDISIEQAFQEADGVISNILRETEGEESVFEYFQGLRRVNTEILQGRKDIPEPIRALMGEITEPAENIVLTVSKMARLVETNKFFESVDRLGAENYIFDGPLSRDGVEYTAKITGTNSVLDGKYTTVEMLTALKEKESMLLDGAGGAVGDLYRNFLTLKGGAQLVKTVYSHVTHLRNVLGGAQFGLANGTNPFGKEGVQTLSVLKNRIAQGGDEALDEMYQKYLRLGIINTNVRVNEFRALLDTGFESKAGTFAQKISEKLKGYGLSEQAQKLPEEVYMAVDDFYKVTNFEYELDVLKKAFPDEAIEVLEARAADIVQNTFPNYDRVPKGIKAIRYLPIGNFVSFPTEIWRTSANILKQASAEINSGSEVLRRRGVQRMAGYGATLVGWGAIADGTAQLAGLTPDEAEAAQYLSETPWSRAPRNFVRIDGKLYANDTQFINSYSAISTPFTNAYKAIQDGRLRGEQLDQILGDAIFEGSKALLAPYIEESIFTKAVADVGIAFASDSGRTPEGKQLFTPGLPKTEKAVNAFEHLALAFEPGSIKSLRDLAGAALEVPNKNTGQPKDLRAELFTNLTGIRFTEMRPEDALMYSVKDYNYKSQNIVRPQAKYGMEASDVETRYDQRQRQLYEYQQDLYAKYAAAEQLMGRGAAIKVLLDSGLSENQVGFLVANIFRPEQPSETLMLDMFEKLPEEEKRNNADAISSMWRRYAQYSRTKLIRPVEEPSAERQRRAKGGQVFVPQAPSEPDERIDKMTGLPYNIQAGSAFIDEEDPEKRMMADGGLVHPENKKFFEDFHNRVVSEGRELVEDDKTTTMRILGVGIGGKEYLIPSYDPDTKRVLSMDEAVEKYMPLIQEGKIKGYNTPQEAEADRRMFYPEIVGRTKKFQGGIAQMLGIDPQDLEWAKSLGKKFGQAEELDGRGDAARHLALGWLAKKSNYPSLTKFAINAREALDLDFKGGPMDVENNKRGFSLPAENREEAERQIMEAIDTKAARFYTPSESRQMRGYVEGGKVEDEDAFFDQLSMAIGQKVFGDSNIREEFRGIPSMANVPGDFNPEAGEYANLGPDAPFSETLAKETEDYIMTPAGPVKKERQFSEGAEAFIDYNAEALKEYETDLARDKKLWDEGKISKVEQDVRNLASTIDYAMTPITDLVDATTQYIPYFEEAAQYISETEAAQSLAKLAADNPRAAENIQAIVEVLGVIPAVKFMERFANKIAANVATNVDPFYKVTGQGAKMAVMAGEFLKAIPSTVADLAVPSRSAFQRRTGITSRKLELARQQSGKNSPLAEGDANAELATVIAIGRQLDDEVGLIHNNNSYKLSNEYSYIPRFNEKEFKQQVFGTVKEGGYLMRGIPEEVQEAAMQHMLDVWKVDKDNLRVVIKRPDALNSPGNEALAIVPQGQKVPVVSKLFSKEFLNYINRDRARDGLRPVKKLDTITPEQIKNYLLSKQTTFTQGPGDYIFVRESHRSSSKELGGVNDFVAINTKTGDVHVMITDKHDIGKDINPLGGGDLIHAVPMVTRNIKNHRTATDLRKDKNYGFVERDKKEEARLAIQQARELGITLPKKLMSSLTASDPKNSGPKAFRYILEQLEKSPNTQLQDYVDVGRRGAIAGAGSTVLMNDDED